MTPPPPAEPPSFQYDDVCVGLEYTDVYNQPPPPPVAQYSTLPPMEMYVFPPLVPQLGGKLSLVVYVGEMDASIRPPPAPPAPTVTW